MAASETIDFAAFPKQWIAAPDDAPQPPTRGGHAERAAGWRVQAAPGVPLVPVESADGVRVGLLVGWAIVDGRMPLSGRPLRLAAGDTPEGLLRDLAGRAVLLWRGTEGPCLQLDAGGFLPATYDAAAGLVASTSALIALAAARRFDTEVAAVFDFPRRRGFLPFGLTAHRGVRRLLPSHRLDLGSFEAVRVWPTPDAPLARLPEGDAAAQLLHDAADRVRAHCGAVAAVAAPHLYLSGGHDSRMVLAALRDHAHRLTCETLRNADSLDLHVARQAADAAGARHVVVDVTPTPPDELEAWLGRTGHCFYDPVSELARTAVLIDRRRPVMDGIGAEILRASNWQAEDLEAEDVPVGTLLARLRLPDVPRIRERAEAWVAGLPPVDRAAALDLAKIDIIHGCWSGPSVYGHDIQTPSVSPFASQRTNEAALAMPKAWKAGSTTYRIWMEHLWPALLDVPVNRATGLDRLRFLESGLRAATPPRLKRLLKPLR